MAARPPLSHTAPPSDPRLRNALPSGGEHSKTLICRDFVWGICNKATQCKFRHELEFDSMRNILKFCHDYQNKTGCARADCTYLHVTREEENLFLTTGQVPRVLAARHAAAMPCISNIYGLSSDSLTAPPPPPPPVPSAVTAAPPPLPPPSPVLMPPPPPPPPTTAVTPVLMTPPMFSAPPPIHPTAMFQASQQQVPSFPNFDSTRPPPPLTTSTLSVKTGLIKRTADSISSAGPSKVQKRDASKDDCFCENCAQLEIRIKVLRQNQEKLEGERDCKTFIYEKKSEEYENAKLLLKCAVNPKLYRLVDEYIEGTTSQLQQAHDLLAHFGATSSFASETSTVPKQFLLKLMDFVFRDNVQDTSPLITADDEDSAFLQTLARLANRNTPVVSPNLAQAFFEALSAPEKTQANEIRTNVTSLASSSTKNGPARYLSAPKPESASATVVPRHDTSLTSGASTSAPQPYLATAPVVAPTASVFPFAETAVAPVTASVPPPSNMPTSVPSAYLYQPNMPPPNVRPAYYSMPYGGVHSAPVPPRLAPSAPYHPYPRFPPHTYYQPPYQ